MVVGAVPKPVQNFNITFIVLLKLVLQIPLAIFIYQPSVLIIFNNWIYYCYDSHVIFWYLCLLILIPK